MQSSKESGETFPCPICRKPVSPGARELPFCSARCRLVDLGKWLNDDYRVSRSLGPTERRHVSPEDVEDAPSTATGEADEE